MCHCVSPFYEWPGGNAGSFIVVLITATKTVVGFPESGIIRTFFDWNADILNSSSDESERGNR